MYYSELDLCAYKPIECCWVSITLKWAWHSIYEVCFISYIQDPLTARCRMTVPKGEDSLRMFTKSCCVHASRIEKIFFDMCHTTWEEFGSSFNVEMRCPTSSLAKEKWCTCWRCLARFFSEGQKHSGQNTAAPAKEMSHLWTNSNYSPFCTFCLCGRFK